MNLTKQIARHLREIHFGGNWTSSNLKDNLVGVSWQQASISVYSFNTIAMLVYHINYYVNVLLLVMNGQPLNAHDKYSFEVPAILSQDDWEKLLEKVWADAEDLARKIENMDELQLWENVSEEKYGNYYRNFHGIIEHTHYHLGQIVLIKKIIPQEIEK